MTQLSSPGSPRAKQPQTQGVVSRILAPLNSVWLGISLATILFFYCSVGSAVPAVRQHPLLEMTEFEWFHWWPFNALVILFCVTLTVVTIRRVPLRRIHLGVWMIHTGIIILCLGSYLYFGTKVEGDAPVFRRRVRIELPGVDQSKTIPAILGSRTSIHSGSDRWDFQVQSTNTQWTISTPPDVGKTAYTVSVMVTPPSGDPFIRQLLAGYPQYTEDIIPRKGRAIKELGRKLVEEQLKLTLEYEPQTNFHVMKTWAIFVRDPNQTKWAQRPIHGMPRYHDRIASRDHVFMDANDQVPLRTLDLAVPPAESGDVLAGTEVRVTGYLRHARMQQRWRDGGQHFNPVLRATLLQDNATSQRFDLLALDPAHRQSDDGLVQFMWLDDDAEHSALPTDSRATLHIGIPGTEKHLTIALAAENVTGEDGPFIPIEDTEFSYRIVNVQPELVVPTTGQLLSVAMVDVKTATGQFRRMVADRPELTRDMHGDSPDPHTPAAREAKNPDGRIKMSYQPRTAPIILAASVEGLHLVVNGSDGRMLARDLMLGEIAEVVPGLSIRADAMWTHAVPEVKPFVVPRSARQRNAQESYAMIRLEIGSGDNVQSRWMRFNQYVFENEQYAYQGRFAYQTELFRLPNGREVEIVFSRERRELPAPIALEEFTLDTHLGGYTGQVSTIRNYVSRLRFLDGDTWTDPVSIQVNAPTEFGGYWYFQSMWDKPSRGDPSGGMNYTGLGVGNRNGVYIQLAGCVLAVLGMLYVFYLKPLLIRQKVRQSSAGASAPSDEESPELEAIETKQTVEV